MPVTLETRENGRVQYFRFVDPWRIPDLTVLFPVDNDYRNSVSFVVHTLADMTETEIVPPGVMAARHGVPVHEHPRSGLFVMAGANNFHKVMTTMVLRSLKNTRNQFFSTVDEAWAYLRKWIAEHPE